MELALFDDRWFSDAIQRLYDRDASLFSGDDETQRLIKNRLGWLDAPEFSLKKAEELEGFARDAADRGFSTATQMGMGGSSLSTIVFADAFGQKPGLPAYAVLDTTEPSVVAQFEERAGKPLFIVASKSGTTLETLTHYRYFKERAPGGSGFAAITDQGSFLHETAEKEGFLRVFLNPKDIGGRFSGLSYFGMAGAALLGADVGKLALDGKDMAERCRQTDPEANPGIMLASYMAKNLKDGRDKLTLITDKRLESFGLWVEQLLAESLGKEKKGIIPVAAEPMGPLSAYGDDRFFVFLGLGGEEHPWVPFAEDLRAGGVPVLIRALGDVYDLGGEMFTWMVATALVGAVMGVNPFDEPNVAESKANSNKVIEEFKSTGALPLPRPDADGFAVSRANLGGTGDLAGCLGELLRGLGAGAYFSTLAYLPYSEEVDIWAGDFRAKVMQKTGRATTFGYGPRYLHSTGQLFKGGPEKGSFLVLTREPEENIEVPGAGYGFGDLILAQALGDFKALADRKRPILHLHLPKDHLPVLEALKGMADRLVP